MTSPYSWLGAWLRKRDARTARPPLEAVLRAPLPDLRTPAREVPYLVLDLETTGLRPERDESVSFGWVPVQDGRVWPGEGGYISVRPKGDMNQTATIHGLTDGDLAGGMGLEQALEPVLNALKGRVLVAHHAPLDLGFLSHACLHTLGAACRVPWVDTLVLGHRRLFRPGQELPDEALRLHSLRRHFHLPDYPAHNAFTDALATAELLLAFLADGQPKLRDVVG